MKADSLFVIARRHIQSIRLNHEVYTSVEQAKAELDGWESEEDPRREFYLRYENFESQNMAYYRKKRSPFHNNRDFEVVDIATHLNNVAVQNYEKAKRDGSRYLGAFNTTESYQEKLQRLLKEVNT